MKLLTTKSIYIMEKGTKVQLVKTHPLHNEGVKAFKGCYGYIYSVTDYCDKTVLVTFQKPISSHVNPPTLVIKKRYLKEIPLQTDYTKVHLRTIVEEFECAKLENNGEVMDVLVKEVQNRIKNNTISKSVLEYEVFAVIKKDGSWGWERPLNTKNYPKLFKGLTL